MKEQEVLTIQQTTGNKEHHFELTPVFYTRGKKLHKQSLLGSINNLIETYVHSIKITVITINNELLLLSISLLPNHNTILPIFIPSLFSRPFCFHCGLV